jgi:hypothetical protein
MDANEKDGAGRFIGVRRRRGSLPGDAEVIDHLSALVVCDAVDRLRVHDQLAVHHKVGNIFTDNLSFV